MRPGRINTLPIWVGAALTATVLGCVIWAGLSPICDAAGACAPRWKLLANAPANELGDTLSGVGSVLAFIWVIVTVWMQSIQLQLQRRDMHAQQAETRRMTEATVVQARIYQQEQDERAEDRAGKELEALVDRLLTSAEFMQSWDGSGPLFAEQLKIKDEARRFDAVLDRMILEGRAVLSRVAGGEALLRLTPDDARQVALYLDEIDAIQPRLSRADRIWLTKFELAQATKVLDDLLAQPALWTDATEGP
ncbi:hypothetical protein [Paracoccus sp. S1E-3]|uniref:hypothetical protein n=1 Tax=Paracoccus sp. S1E-3 TaxID=2756130 RepID=UPI0015EEE8DA|nr:hypothetical protein [Paracoccus sp. S1E-3]MBA4491206.1 hypothetical protein [Paracoccus sp. S1E-3]